MGQGEKGKTAEWQNDKMGKWENGKMGKWEKENIKDGGMVIEIGG